MRSLFVLIMIVACVHFSHVDGYDRTDLCIGFVWGMLVSWWMNT